MGSNRYFAEQANRPSIFRQLLDRANPFNEFAIFRPVTLPFIGEGSFESFRNFGLKMYSKYQYMQKALGFTVIEGNQLKLKRQKAKVRCSPFAVEDIHHG